MVGNIRACSAGTSDHGYRFSDHPRLRGRTGGLGRMGEAPYPRRPDQGDIARLVSIGCHILTPATNPPIDAGRPHMSVQVLYDTQATATGGRDGRVTTADGTLDLTMST